MVLKRNALRNSLVVPYCTGFPGRVFLPDLLDEVPAHEKLDHPVSGNAANALYLSPRYGLGIRDDRQRFQGGLGEMVLAVLSVALPQLLPKVLARSKSEPASDLHDLQAVAVSFQPLAKLLDGFLRRFRRKAR